MAETEFDDELLREHMKSGRNDEVVSLLQGVDPSRFVGKYKCTLLHLAAEYDNEEFAQHLLGLGADVNAKNNIEETPLAVAVKNQNEEIVKILLNAGADMCMPNTIFEGCVLSRALDRSDEMKSSIRQLILNNATIDILRKSPFTRTRAFHKNCPLYNFVYLKNIELTVFLLEIGSPVNFADPLSGTTALRVAVEILDVEHVKLLLRHGANVTDQQRYRSPLGLISYDSTDDISLEIVKILMNTGASLTDHGGSKLLENGNRQLIRAVLQCKPDLFDGHLRPVIVFTRYNTESTEYPTVPVEYLLSNKNPGVYEELKNYDIDFNTRFGDNKTLLHRVIGKDDPIAMQFLIDRGLDVNAKDNNDLTPLCMAVDICSMREREMLDTDPDLPEGSRNVMEDYWVRRCECVSILLENGADPQIRPKPLKSFRDSHHEDQLMVDRACQLIKPVLVQLALQQASGRAIEQTVLSGFEQRPEFETIFNSSKQQLAETKQIQLDEAVTLFDFLIVNRVSVYANSEILLTNLTELVNGYNVNSYYYDKLQKKFLKLVRMVAINDIFVNYYNISAIEIAEKIVDYF